MTAPETNRRDFLTGRSAARSVESLVEGTSGSLDKELAPSSTAGQATYLLEVGRRAMACDFQVLINAGQYQQAPEYALEALDLIEQLEEQLTIFRDTSEISRLNRMAAERPVKVEPRLYQLLKQSRELYEQTSGAFDVTAGPLARIWGFVRRKGRMPSPEDIALALERVGSQYLRMMDDETSIGFDRAGMEINLGAIGKGYALDRCAEILRAHGINDFLLHGGQSSILAAGNRAGESGWLVGLRDPMRPERRIAEIRLRDRAIGTSGTANQFFHHDGRRYGHIVDPRSGWPAERLVGTTVLAATAAEADALATAFFVLGCEAAESFCASRPDLSAILIAPGQRSGELQIHTIRLVDDDWRLLDY